MTQPRTFDLAEDLPEATTVLEASAGTGKTYAIVGLAARYLAEGVPISSMLLVTFSRAATAELRERMRERVRALLRALDPGAVATDDSASDDRVVALLRSGTPAQQAAYRDNLRRAMADFDASTIATTHTFCNRMLEVLGLLGEREMVYSIVEEVDDLTEEVALDLYLRGYAASPAPDFDYEVALSIAKDAVRQPAVDLVPDPGIARPDESGTDRAGEADRVASMRVRFAARVRDIVEERKRSGRLRTYDDLQTILYRIITDPDVGADACARIRNTFQVALVDEFQDTDPLQWEILRRCFHGHRRLILVGDPKQSIYGFRGAEVLSYLNAVTCADTLRALDVNRRSDGALVSALSAIYGGATLGDPRIVARPVSAAHPGSRIDDVAPLQIRAFLRQDFGENDKTGAGLPKAAAARDKIIADVADDVADRLAAGHTIEADGSRRPIRAGDIAILVRQNKTIEPLRSALADRGVHAVIGSGANVFHTAAAQHWLWVLRAVELPSRNDRVRLAALTPLCGWSAGRIDAEGETGTAELAAEFATLGKVLADGGFAAMAQRLLDRNEVAARVLAAADGERSLTDLLQISTLCNAHVVDTGAGIAGVSQWLADRIADDSRRQRTDESSRRLERDAQAVQIMTVHASKGLQFPIVYVPFGWDGTWITEDGNITFHDEQGVRRLDVGGRDGPGRSGRRLRYGAEVAGEDLRLLYVALTRAQSQAVLWWVPTANTPTGPLHRLVFGRDSATSPEPGGPWTAAPRVDIPDDANCVAQLKGLSLRDRGVEIIPAGRRGATTVIDADGAAGRRPELALAHFDRPIDADWRRTSYSAIIAGAAHTHVTSGSEPDATRLETALDDEPTDESGAESDDWETEVGNVTGLPSPMNGLPFGAGFGTLVHEVLEYVDTSAPDMRAHVAELVARATAGRGDGMDPLVLTDALCAVLTTPLGFGDLWGIAPGDRLAELDFELPLGGSAPVRLGVLADLMDRHLPADDPLLEYSERLRELPDRVLSGYLTGSIDSVLRTPQGRFVIVDYKTNRLRPGVLQVTDFDAPSLAEEMIGAHYPLQAMLYSVALHRYLRWRMPAYDPAVHLGVVQYHFVRGMAGPLTPPGCGVFEWRLPPQLVIDLSDALAGRQA